MKNSLILLLSFVLLLLFFFIFQDTNQITGFATKQEGKETVVDVDGISAPEGNTLTGVVTFQEEAYPGAGMYKAIRNKYIRLDIYPGSYGTNTKVRFLDGYNHVIKLFYLCGIPSFINNKMKICHGEKYRITFAPVRRNEIETIEVTDGSGRKIKVEFLVQ